MVQLARELHTNIEAVARQYEQMPEEERLMRLLSPPSAPETVGPLERLLRRWRRATSRNPEDSDQ